MTIPIPAKYRAILYWVNTLAVVAFSIIATVYQVGYGTRPVWLDASIEGLAALAALVGVTAATNINGDAIDPTALPPRLRIVLNWASSIVNALIVLAALAYRLPILMGVEPIVLDIINQVLLLIGGILSGVAASHVVPNPPPADEAQPEAVIGTPRSPQGW